MGFGHRIPLCLHTASLALDVFQGGLLVGDLHLDLPGLAGVGVLALLIADLREPLLQLLKFLLSRALLVLDAR